jgi:asparagine synthase (glutamine-hydrolysing)
MCGIVGFVAKKRNHYTVEKMLKVQAHRGPDDRGIWVEELAKSYVHLGHNRLAIQDLSKHAHQPFVSTCGAYSIVFNGEIYNFKAIRDMLEQRGHTFVSKSDTEVILYAYKAWGMKCLDKFIGMFAFVLVDKTEQKMYLVRDRAGVKPLYYYDNGDTFLFSSELKSFHAHEGFSKKLNKDVLPYYFQLGYIPAPHTIYQNSHKLEAGHYMVYDIAQQSYEIKQYWSVDTAYAQEKYDKSETEILHDLENLLEDAVNLRMVADVPVGVFLSGGYDSTLVTALLAKNHKDLHTFSIGFNDKAYNEATHAKEIAKYFGTKHTEQYVSTQEMLAKVEELPFTYDEPFGDSSAIPTMILSSLAHKDVKVALSGDGGDEAFCGYSKYFFLEKCSTLFSSTFKKKLLQTTLHTLSPSLIESVNGYLPAQLKQTNIREKYRKFKQALQTQSIEEMFLEASSSVATAKVASLLKIAKKPHIYAKFHMKEADILDEMMRIDYQTFMVDDVLTKVDRATMSVGLEGRGPLLDHRIVEYMARVPTSLKYKNNQGKYLARQILYKHIPQSLVDKPKSGFQVPLATWLQNELKPLVQKYLHRSNIDDEIFDIHEVERIKKELFLGDISHINVLWYLLMYEMWKEKWFNE